ncbi:gag pre-integrs domain-containing protein [Abeliophyllum distichum]|uniref:Gag pre-integrs domain-containing protein n=1 Tax=Abeliophyllum distichum TaxID=126358 RepID=A0ABD1W2T1_9LAMI
MDLGNDLESDLSDFSEIVKSLAHNDKKIDNENLAIILLNSLLDSYRVVRNAIKYARDVLTQAIVIDPLSSKDLEIYGIGGWDTLGTIGLKYLNDLNLLGKDTVVQLSFCEMCVLGKSHRVGFEIGQHGTKRPLDYIHADLWDLEKHHIHGGNRFFLSIVDDCSRKVLAAMGDLGSRYRVGVSDDGEIKP